MSAALRVRRTEPADFAGIRELCLAAYPWAKPWTDRELASQREVFPEGQLVAADRAGRVLGMAASLIVHWADHGPHEGWRGHTAAGTFRDHDPEHGHTLYGAELMVHPEARGRGVGAALYAARKELVRRLGLVRLRAGARLAGYHAHAARMDARAYVDAVLRGELRDPTLSFQLAQGFHVVRVMGRYLPGDPESLGWAALIEWRPPTPSAEASGSGR